MFGFLFIFYKKNLVSPEMNLIVDRLLYILYYMLYGILQEDLLWKKKYLNLFWNMQKIRN